MSKMGEINGNDFVDLTINENEISKRDMDNILNFIHDHKNVYLYGKGLCGKGFKEYADVCGFDNVKGFVTSDMIDEFLLNYESAKDGVILTLKGDYYPEILPLILKKIKLEDILFLRERTKQIFAVSFSRKNLDDNFWLVLPLAKHCNINCASCNMFAPLCSPEFYTLENVKKDLIKIKSIGLNLKRINITGGEPFLNPETVDILTFIRSIYPDLKIDVYTNGFLIADYSDEQFKNMKKSNVEFHITEYGIEKDKLQKVYEKFEVFAIPYIVNNDNNKLFFKKKIDFDKNVPVYEYINCQYYTFCFSAILFNGNLYKCPMALNAENINKYTEKKLELTDMDYLKLDSVNSSDQIHDYWRSRLPMCGYCPRVSDVVSWKRSERDIDEWR